MPWPEKAMHHDTIRLRLLQLIEGRTDCADGCFRIRQQRASAAESVHETGVKRGENS